MLSRLVIAFSSKEQASFNFMAAVTICSDFGAQENKERLSQTKFARLIWSLHFQCYKIAWDLLVCAECKHHPRPHYAAAKSLQSCPTLCDPIDGSPPGSPAPGILQARTLEWVAISFSNEWKWKLKVKSLSHVQPSVTPWTEAFQAPPSVGFSRQEYWSGVPLPPPDRCYLNGKHESQTKHIIVNWPIRRK